MRQIVVSVTAPGNSVPIPLDVHGRPEISLQVVSGGGTWGVQQTLDNPFTTPLANINWFPHPDAALTGASGNKQGNYAYVPAALRLVTTGVGNSTLTVVQAGIIG